MIPWNQHQIYCSILTKLNWRRSSYHHGLGIVPVQFIILCIIYLKTITLSIMKTIAWFFCCLKIVLISSKATELIDTVKKTSFLEDLHPLDTFVEVGEGGSHIYRKLRPTFSPSWCPSGMVWSYSTCSSRIKWSGCDYIRYSPQEGRGGYADRVLILILL